MQASARSRRGLFTCASALSTRAVAAARFCLQAGVAAAGAAVVARAADTAPAGAAAAAVAVRTGDAVLVLRRSAVTGRSGGRAGFAAGRQSCATNGHADWPQPGAMTCRRLC